MEETYELNKEKTYFFLNYDQSVAEGDNDMFCQCKIDRYGWLVVGFKANYLTSNLGLWMGCPPWGEFLRDPTGENYGKLRNGYVDKQDRELNLALSVYQF